MTEFERSTLVDVLTIYIYIYHQRGLRCGGSIFVGTFSLIFLVHERPAEPSLYAYSIGRGTIDINIISNKERNYVPTLPLSMVTPLCQRIYAIQHIRLLLPLRSQEKRISVVHYNS